MPFTALREFLKKLESAGQLKRVQAEVHWDQEITAISQESLMRRGPALLFENIANYRKTHGKRVAVGMIESLERAKIAMELPPTASRRDMVQIWRERVAQPVPPKLVRTGPCKEVIEKGKDVDLLEFPVPKIHSRDGGRYLLTWCLVVTKDPENGWVNVGVYRGMVLDKSRIAVYYLPFQHWGLQGRKYRQKGKSMPVAAVIGVEPITNWVAATAVPSGACEYDIAGAIRGVPVELVKCETVDLEVPSTAEIVIEGEMSLDPAEFQPEGPFGEYVGHYVSINSRAPVMKVKCVTHRKDPISTTRMVGVVSPSVVTEQGTFLGISNDAFTLNELEARGIHGVREIRGAGPAGMITIVSLDQLYYGHAKEVALALWSLKAHYWRKIVIVVDSDVDITDLDKVMVAVATRTRPGQDILIFPGTPGGTLDPSNHPEVLRKTDGVGNWDRVLIDATWPMEWEPREEWGGLRHPPSCLATEEILQKVRRRWKEYGLD